METKYFCRNCKGDRNHKLIHKHSTRGREADWLDWIDDYMIIECLGCNTISFLNSFGDSEMYYETDEGAIEYYTNDKIFPQVLEEGYQISNSYELPEKINIIYQETITSIKAGTLTLSGAGLRAIIEAVCLDLKIKEKNLELKIDSLHTKGHITKRDSKRLHSIRFLGNGAIHQIETPSKKQVYILLEIVNHILEGLYINDKKLEGSVDTIIDSYDRFLSILRQCISNDMINQKIDLKKILGKKSKLISKEDLIAFEDNLNDDIRKKKINFIKIHDDSKKIVQYEITSIPSRFKLLFD